MQAVMDESSKSKSFLKKVEQNFKIVFNLIKKEYKMYKSNSNNNNLCSLSDS